MRLGYTNVWRYPQGWYGWLDAHPEDKRNDAPVIGGIYHDRSFSVLGGAPDREYLGLNKDARHFTLYSVATEVLVLQFFNCLCVDCINELEAMERVRGTLGDTAESILFLGIAIHDTKRNVAAFRRQDWHGFPLVVDNSAESIEELGLASPPLTCILRKTDSGFTIHYVGRGPAAGESAFIQKIQAAARLITE